MKNQPLVSIIIPTYNRAHLICETLDSILAQTYESWECIVVDDGSNDNTKEVLKSYIDKDTRFQYHHRPSDRPKGGNACRNYGFELSKGKYIKWFDSDDIMLSNFLDKQVDFFQNNQCLDFCVCQCEYFFENGTIQKFYTTLNPINHPIYAYFLEGHVFLTPLVLWKKDFLEGKDLFDLQLFRSQEADFHFRMLVHNPKYIISKDFLCKIRRGHESIESTSKNLIPQLSILRFFRKAFEITEKLNFPNQEKVLKYLIFRNLVQIYSIISTQSFFKRLKYLVLIKEITSYQKYLNFMTAIKMFIGFFGVILFKKGHFLLYLKQFDYRKNENF